MDTTFDTGSGARRGIIFAIIVAFHVVLVWALNSELSTIIAERLPPVIKAEIIEAEPEAEEPPPPPPEIKAPPPYVPPPDIVISAPVQSTAPSTAITVTRERPPVAPPVAKAAVKTAPTQDKKFARRFQPEYPPTSRRLGEEGSVTLQVLVGTDGKVTDGKVQQSSGFPRLDEAALKHALRAWRFNPGTEDGKPVQMWHSIKVTFKITN